MNHLKLAFIVLSAIFLLGCATPQKMYYWGDYSNTLYQSKKHPSEQTSLGHQQALENIIAESGKNNLRIPPGVHAELGYIYFRQNKKDLAIQNFNMEKQLYPESAILMDRLENAVKLADKAKPAPSEQGKNPEVAPGPPDKQEK
ncbi:MAG: DUF4810 domain-containing protein [Syntrophales bacterium]|jgi:hypothetical protein|nr:DUF4810 domain-containing protein [Syntrophales bacterium]